jgi:hypothetical protein
MNRATRPAQFASTSSHPFKADLSYGWILLLSVVLAFVPSEAAFARHILENDQLRVEFDGRGLASLHDKALSKTIRFEREGFSLHVNQATLESHWLEPEQPVLAGHSVTYRHPTPGWDLRVVYELKPGWRFVSKQLFLSATTEDPFRVERVEPFRGTIQGDPGQEQRVRSGSFLRFRAGSAASESAPGYGMFFALQNPFLQWRREGGAISMAYAPGMEWKQEYGAFESDRVCIGTYSLSGFRHPAGVAPEWKFNTNPNRGTIDMAEVEAMTECVRAFLLFRPNESLRVHVGWCLNDYQVDVGTVEGRTEYKRIIDQAAAVGMRHLLYTPTHGGLTSLRDNRDAWGWENLLWLNLGQKIRKNEWDPRKDDVPDSVQEMIDYSNSRGIKLLAYVYPSLPFMQESDWTRWTPNPGGYAGADTGIRTFQDWLIDQMVAFHAKTGISGFSFDHWWIAYDNATSKYAQWHGCRRILEELRKRIPDVVLDGRQQYHQFGVWTWLAGSYPHPFGTDEQPVSIVAFPDLHWSRVSGNRQRWVSWWFRMNQFTPTEILPGFMTHQSQRSDASGTVHRDRFRPRDWDYLGWKFSVISSVATAPFHHVLNYLPARDPDEFKHFPETDRKWLRDWLDWTDHNFETLRRVRHIIGQAEIGRVDGTAAFLGERGFIFLFNPNYRPLPAAFTLDGSIGLERGAEFLVRQLYPDAEKGRLIPMNSRPFWRHGEKVVLPMPGTDALVLEVIPAPEKIAEPMLFNATGQASLSEGRLHLTGVLGEMGSEKELLVLLPSSQPVESVRVNGWNVPSEQSGNLVRLRVRFDGPRFERVQQVGSYVPDFAGGTYRATGTIPSRVFEQLRARKRLWPIPFTEDDLKATWLGPDRLLLFINVAEPADKMEVRLKINGQTAEVKRAYTSIYGEGPRQTFTGWYVDVSGLEPDRQHSFELQLPELAPGQFQGLFLENVEAEFTPKLAERFEAGKHDSGK